MARIRTLVNRLVPAGASLDEVLTAVAVKVGRPVRVKDAPLDDDTSGVWVRTADVDWILVGAAGLERRLQVIGHEVGHIVLGHGDRVARSHYDDPLERDAELFGTLLVRRMRMPRLGSASAALR